MTKTRSEMMANIRGRNTSPELLLRSALWRTGYRYRLYYPTPVGKPDLVFLRHQTVVFVDGCQWHGCPEHYVKPRSKQDFWADKLLVNVLRDVRQTLALKNLGWKVVRLWEHEIFEDVDRAVGKVVAQLTGLPAVDDEGWRVWKVDVVNAEEDLEIRYLRTLGELPSERSVVRRRSTRKWKNRASGATTEKNA